MATFVQEVPRMAPPLYSTFAAITELVVTAAVVYFFHQALRHGRYRWGIIIPALVYEILFNITYMTYRLLSPGAAHDYPAWFSAFLGFHGTLSLVMFLGLIAFVVWAFDQHGKEDPDPIGSKPRLVYTFLALWAVSILTGEIIYALQWTDWVTV